MTQALLFIGAIAYSGVLIQAGFWLMEHSQ